METIIRSIGRVDRVREWVRVTKVDRMADEALIDWLLSKEQGCAFLKK